ncbi:hypothetical protein AAY473_017029 [Plecturocebus cupreus]
MDKLRWSFILSPRLEYSGMISAHSNLCLLDSSNSLPQPPNVCRPIASCGLFLPAPVPVPITSCSSFTGFSTRNPLPIESHLSVSISEELPWHMAWGHMAKYKKRKSSDSEMPMRLSQALRAQWGSPSVKAKGGDSPYHVLVQK